jgi:glucose/arabinose dehydrogenase
MRALEHASAPAPGEQRARQSSKEFRMSRPASASSKFASRIAVTASLLASSVAYAQSEEVHNSALYSFKVVTVVDGLVNPWSMAWLPNGDMLVTERPGRLRIVRGGTLLPNAVPGVPPVRVVGQGGLQDVVVHPSFAQNRLVYLSFAKPSADGSQGTTTIVRGRFENDKLDDVQQIFEAAPYAGSPGHYGARMVFDGNGHLFVSSGDRMAPSAGDLERHPAQDLSHHHGKILRLNEDGSVPKDNPFVGKPNVRPEIWSYGHRNPQGLVYDAATGALWETEHGPQGGDEINLIKPSLNYGWPVITYGMNYGSGTDIGARAREGLVQPAAFWVPSIAPSGLMIYHGDKFPLWNGNAFAGGMSGGYRQLSRVMIEGERVTNREPLLQLELRIRDVRQGPDGFIYIATDNQLSNPTPIVRLEPVAETPRPAARPR